MNNLLDISSITSNKLRRGEYKSILPEYYSLESVVENNPWHVNQNVFDHSVAVFSGLEKVLKLNFLAIHEKQKIKKYLENKVGKYKRQELLIVSTLLHDIAKNDVIIKDSTGNTQGPGHEIIGSIMVSKFSSRFGLDDTGEKIIERIVLFHGFTNNVLTLIIKKKKESKFFTIFKEVVGDIYIELLLLMNADMMGSNLRNFDSSEFNKREDLIINLLKKSI